MLHQRALARFFLSLAVGLLAGFLATFDLKMKIVVGWNFGASTAIALHLWLIGTSDAEDSRLRAAARDPGRKMIWALALAACCFSIVGATVLMGDMPENEQHPNLVVGLCIWSVACTWLLTQSVFTLRYAHLYYRDAGGEGGLEFPGDEPPDDLDFAYYAFTVGMCFQVSDVVITDRGIRRTTLIHGVVSYFYNTMILALVVNLTVGHLH